MELNKNNALLNEEEEDIDGDLIGRKVKVPQCATCIHNNDGFCEIYKEKIINLEDNNVDIFNCPNYKEKNINIENRLKNEFGFKG